MSSFPILTQFELQAPLFGLSPVHPFYRLLFSLVPRSRSSEMLILLVKRFYVNENGCVIRGDNGRTWNSGKESLKKKKTPFNGKGNGKKTFWSGYVLQALYAVMGSFPWITLWYICMCFMEIASRAKYVSYFVYLSVYRTTSVGMDEHTCLSM